MENILRHAKDVVVGDAIGMGAYLHPYRVDKIEVVEGGKIEMVLFGSYNDKIYNIRVLPNDLFQMSFSSYIINQSFVEPFQTNKEYQQEELENKLSEYNNLPPLKKLFTKKPKQKNV